MRRDVVLLPSSYDGEYALSAVSLWHREPVFHAPRREADRSLDVELVADGRRLFRARCGVVLREHEPRTGRLRRSSILVPPYHALRIGRLCSRCFPEAK